MAFNGPHMPHARLGSVSSLAWSLQPTDWEPPLQINSGSNLCSWASTLTPLCLSFRIYKLGETKRTYLIRLLWGKNVIIIRLLWGINVTCKSLYNAWHKSVFKKYVTVTTITRVERLTSKYKVVHIYFDNMIPMLTQGCKCHFLKEDFPGHFI